MAKRKTIIPKAPLRKILKKQGVNLIEKAALDMVTAAAENFAACLGVEALKLSKHRKAKKVNKADISMALKYGDKCVPKL